jgi:hypothetical protein
MGHIYLINESGTENYKIGLTKNPTKKRKSQLQTGNSSELNVVKSFETKHPARLEKLLHMQHANKRGLGEWFLLEPEDVFGFISLCEKLTETINYLLLNNEFFNKEFNN